MKEFLDLGDNVIDTNLKIDNLGRKIYKKPRKKRSHQFTTSTYGAVVNCESRNRVMNISLKQLKSLIKEAIASNDNYDLKLSSELQKFARALQDISLIKFGHRQIIVSMPKVSLENFYIEFRDSRAEGAIEAPQLSATIVNDDKLKCKLYGDYRDFECFDNFKLKNKIVSPNEILKLCMAFLRLDDEI